MIFLLIVILLLVILNDDSGGSGGGGVHVTKLGRMNAKELEEWLKTHPRPNPPVGVGIRKRNN